MLFSGMSRVLSMLKRKSGWESILNDHLEKHLNLKRDWGTVDCCMFTCDWVFNSTGEDPAKDFRGTYKTKSGAYKRIKAVATDLPQLAYKIFSKLGMKEGNKFKAKRGDVGLVPGNGGLALGVIDMTGRTIAVQGKEGLDFMPVENIIKAWGVN